MNNSENYYKNSTIFKEAVKKIIAKEISQYGDSLIYDIGTLHGDTDNCTMTVKKNSKISEKSMELIRAKFDEIFN